MGVEVNMTYGSARDLPKFKEMQQQLVAMRLLRFLLPKKDRHLLRELPAQLDHLANTVDSFYALLGHRHWVFHEDLSVDDMANLVTRSDGDPDSAEKAFIGWYQEEDRLPRLVRRLNGLPDLRARMPLLEFALNDYGAERYYAVVQVLLSVMDGFVNDLNPANRKGLHTREADEMDAWDSVVGHHLGLSAAHATFIKSVKARNNEPVYDLYRNGIVHGMLTNYNNVFVATKAWNRLFAVADWARSLEAQKREAEKPPNPTWRELAAQLRANSETKVALDAFSPVAMSQDDPSLVEHPVYKATTEFLEAWQRNNYGAMASSITNVAKKVAPVEVRQDYQGHTLENFTITSLSHSGAAVCTVRVEALVDGVQHTPELRWVREGADGNVATPNQAGDWRLMWWGFPHMTRDEGTASP